MVEVKLPGLEYLPSWLVQVLLAFALFAFVQFVYRIVNFVYVYFLRPGKDLKKYGKWASKLE
jgi:17beta-estradiol 17-dehydrogenase / very-long-chain 3-oxoacyl-CoA reductase